MSDFEATIYKPESILVTVKITKTMSEWRRIKEDLHRAESMSGEALHHNIVEIIDRLEREVGMQAPEKNNAE